MFRLIFIYLPKIVSLMLISVLVMSLLLWGSDGVTEFFGPVLVTTIIAGLTLALYLFGIKKSLACPLCGSPSALHSDDEEVGVLCAHCGYVFVDSPYSVTLLVRPSVSDESVPKSLRFTVRTLLVVTAVLAAVLGLVVYAA